MKKYNILCGNNIDSLKDLDDNSLDVCITDPPYGQGMEHWDKNVPPKETYDRLIAVDQKFKTLINEVNAEHDDGWINYPRLAFDNKGKNAPNYWDGTFVDNVISKVEEI